jgi:hypothetical protein
MDLVSIARNPDKHWAGAVFAIRTKRQCNRWLHCCDCREYPVAIECHLFAYMLNDAGDVQLHSWAFDKSNRKLVHTAGSSPPYEGETFKHSAVRFEMNQSEAALMGAFLNKQVDSQQLHSSWLPHNIYALAWGHDHSDVMDQLRTLAAPLRPAPSSLPQATFAIGDDEADTDVAEQKQLIPKPTTADGSTFRSEASWGAGELVMLVMLAFGLVPEAMVPKEKQDARTKRPDDVRALIMQLHDMGYSRPPCNDCLSFKDGTQPPQSMLLLNRPRQVQMPTAPIDTDDISTPPVQKEQ